MAFIYVNQPVRLILETENSNLASATAQTINYEDPDGTTGSWNATVDGTTIYVDVPGATLTVSGEWYFHAAVTFSGYSYPVIGKRASQYIYDQFDRP